MPLLSFRPEFVPAVENGLDELRAKPPLLWRHLGVRPKRQTIRKLRKYPIRKGDTLYLGTGARTAKYRRLGVATCRQVRSIEIEVADDGRFVLIDGEWLGFLRDPFAAERRLARADGFANARELWEFIEKTHGFPFKGQVIRW